MFQKFLLKMLLSAGFLLIFSTKFVDVTIGERLYEYPLETAWKATGIPLREVNTETWMKLNDRRLSLYELKEIALRVQKKMALRPKTKMLTGEEEDFCYLSFEGMQSNGTNVTVTIQSIRYDGLSETQMGVNTIHNGEMKNLRGYLKDLRQNLAELGSNLDFNVIFVGERYGKISPSMIRELSGRAFRKIKAELVDSAFEEGNSNQIGFSDLINDSIEIGARPVNIEFDTRYDQARNTTQIILATPRTTDGV